MLFSVTRFLSSWRLERTNHGHFGLDFDHFGLIYTYIWMNRSENIRIKQYIYQEKNLYFFQKMVEKRGQNWSSLTQNCSIVPDCIEF